MLKKETKSIACQGCPGAFSHLAAKAVFPGADYLFYPTFDQTLEAVEDGRAQAALVPVENSSAGRVADIHRLFPSSALSVTGEHFVRVRHHLLGIKESQIGGIKTVLSHPQALAQCRKNLTKKGITPLAADNTAHAAKIVAEKADRTIAALASEAAAELYGLKILASGLEDSPLNTTRFWILEKQPRNTPCDHPITSLIFRVKNMPAVLYKCLGGFATNGINLLRIESFVDPDRFFSSAAFLADVEVGQDSAAYRFALQELAFFAEDIKILGTYPADPVRFNNNERLK